LSKHGKTNNLQPILPLTLHQQELTLPRKNNRHGYHDALKRQSETNKSLDRFKKSKLTKTFQNFIQGVVNPYQKHSSRAVHQNRFNLTNSLNQQNYNINIDLKEQNISNLILTSNPDQHLKDEKEPTIEENTLNSSNLFPELIPKFGQTNSSMMRIKLMSVKKELVDLTVGDGKRLFEKNRMRDLREDKKAKLERMLERSRPGKIVEG
jgi:hypothetical protein